MRRALKLLRLAPHDRRVFFRCLACLGAIRLGLGLRGYRALARTLEARLGQPVAPESETKLVWGVRAASRALLGSSCLAQALTLHYLLARAGLRSTLRIGVAGVGGGLFNAHAWVVCDGRIVIGETALGERDFTTLTDLRLHAP